MRHQLKILSKYYKEVIVGCKTFEIRKNDRNYQPGDIVILREIYESGEYTGRETKRIIGYLTDYEQKPGFIVFSINVCLIDE